MKNFLIGFSSGATLTYNMARISSTGIDGFGLSAGVLYNPAINYESVDGLDRPIEQHNFGKQFYSVIGSNDAAGFNQTYFDICHEYMKKSGANVTTNIIRGFNHSFQSYFPEDSIWHPRKSCGDIWYEPPHKSPLSNCGYDQAYYMLSAMNPGQRLVERDENHTKYGTFHAFN